MPAQQGRPSATKDKFKKIKINSNNEKKFASLDYYVSHNYYVITTSFAKITPHSYVIPHLESYLLSI